MRAHIEGAGFQYDQPPVDLADFRRMTALLFTKEYMGRQVESFEWMVLDFSFDACNHVIREQTKKAWLADAVNVMLNCVDEHEEEELEGVDTAKEMCKRYDHNKKKKTMFGTLRGRVLRMLHKTCLKSRQ